MFYRLHFAMPETYQDSAYKALPVDKSADFEAIFGSQLSDMRDQNQLIANNFYQETDKIADHVLKKTASAKITYAFLC